MDLFFSDVGIRDLCCSRVRLVRQFGEALAKRICCRLSMLAAAPTLNDVPSSPPVGLAPIDGKGTYSVTLDQDHLLIFRASTKQAAQAGALESIKEIDIIGPTPVTAARGKRK